MMVVGLEALAAGESPPDTVTVFVTLAGAVAETSTVTVMAAYALPTASASERLQMLAVQVHPVPAMETRVNPDGIVSVTVTVPFVGPVLVAGLVTVTVYVALVCPLVKLPWCVLVIFKRGVPWVFFTSTCV